MTGSPSMRSIPAGHPLEKAGIRTDAELRPVAADGAFPFDNVRVAGSLLAGQRNVRERCGDGVALTSGRRAARSLSRGPGGARRRAGERATMTIAELITEASERAVGYSSDECLKCNVCVTVCPVARVTDLFPGPKYVGPQAQRFRTGRAQPVQIQGIDDRPVPGRHRSTGARAAAGAPPRARPA